MKTETLTSPLYLLKSQKIPHLLFTTLIFITACSVFKEKSFFQADSLQKHNTRREIKTSATLEAQAVRIYNVDDSSEKRFFTEIFPEGFFRYSAEDGFSGNANRVVIDERIKEGRKLRDSARRNENSSTVSHLRENERLLSQTRLREKMVNTSNDSLWYLVGLLLIFAGVYVFRKRLKG